jgi:phytoene desaturase
VTEAMARIAEDMGVEIALNCPVEQVLFEGKRAVGVRTPEGEERGDALVINADFAHAMTRMVPDGLRRRWTNRRIAGKRYSCSTFMLYLGIEGRCDHLEHHTIWMAPDYARNLREIETDHVLSEDPSFYLQNACVTDPTLAPPGMSTLYLLLPVTHQHPNVIWAREKARFRALALKQLGKLGIVDLEKRIRWEQMVTPAEWEQRYACYRGATFSLAHNLGQMLHRRPGNRFMDLESVYLVGGGTHPGSGLPVIFESARISTRLLLEDLGVSQGSPGASPVHRRDAWATELAVPVGAHSEEAW